MTDLTSPIFTNEAAATAHMEADRWPNGVTCPLCGSDNVTKMRGKTQAGMFQCNGCRDKFTVRTGTIFERSHIPLHKWLLATHLLASSKKGISAHQLMRMLGFGSYRTAWFMAHRIRLAMEPTDNGPLGGAGMIVEADETEVSYSRKTKKTPARTRKNAKKFVSLVERGGKVRSKVITGKGESIATQVRNAVKENLDPASTLHTDGAMHYRRTYVPAKHESVDHEREYARTDKDGDRVHVNSAEGYFSIFKRGLVGTYQHMSPQHLHRYLAEFDFRMSNRVRLGVDDAQRANRILKGAEGKRLTYHQPH
ncbi:MAG TPA: IS1595 family transposase [Rhizomicrobium sp.]|jgi:transposase-like protein|nr:IS1595 family transposase [Rhizomicrobium sp.]